MEIAARMQRKCREDSDEEGEGRWAFILRSIDALSPAGMSDEEPGFDREEKVKYVHNIEFRHPGFRTIFHDVDATPENEPLVFSKRGAKRVRRIFTGQVAKRRPPPGLAPQLLPPSYRKLMERGLIEAVSLGSDDEDALRRGDSTSPVTLIRI